MISLIQRIPVDFASNNRHHCCRCQFLTVKSTGILIKITFIYCFFNGHKQWINVISTGNRIETVILTATKRKIEKMAGEMLFQRSFLQCWKGSTTFELNEIGLKICMIIEENIVQ